jgi:RimJ/RimL family protein N-acetyltransferase
MHLTTKRLILRPLQDIDRAPFASMSSDPVVMQFLRALPTRVESDAWIDRQMAHTTAHGFGFGAVIEKDSGAFIGVIGLLHVPYDAHFTPAMEVGWRIARSYWGQGYAPEAGAAALQYGFETLGLYEIVANTAPANHNSQRVMVKLGMTRDVGGDYDHPNIAEGHPLRRQVLYRLSHADWLRLRQP